MLSLLITDAKVEEIFKLQKQMIEKNKEFLIGY